MSDEKPTLGASLRTHKFKFLWLLCLVPLFAVLIFPYSDLAPLLSSRVFEATGNQIYVEAERIELGLIPSPSVQAENFILIRSGTPSPPMRIDRLELSPLLTSLISLKPGARISANGLFGGSFAVSAASSKTVFSSSAGPLVLSALEANDLSIESLLAYFGLPTTYKFSGRLALSSGEFRVDPSFKEKMQGDLRVRLQNLTLPSAIAIPGVFNEPLSIPQMRFRESEFLLAAKDGRIRLTKGQLGSSKESVSGQVLADLDMPSGEPGRLSLGAFKYCLELGFKPEFHAELLAAIPLLEGLRQFRLSNPDQSDASSASLIRYGLVGSTANLSQALQMNSGLTVSPGSCSGFSGGR